MTVSCLYKVFSLFPLCLVVAYFLIWPFALRSKALWDSAITSGERIIQEKKKIEAKCQSSLAELEVAQADLGKTVAQCAKVISKAERVEAHNSSLEASIASKEVELKCQVEEIEHLKAFKLSALRRIRDLEGKMETLTEEVA